MIIKQLHIIFFVFLMLPTFVKSQNLFHQDIFYGGVTAGGFSTGQGFGSGTLNLYIELGSSIRKAYLFSYRVGFPPTVPITVNGIPYLLDTTNLIMNVNHLSTFVSPIQFYYTDLTSDLGGSITSTFNITIPDQFGLPINWGWWTALIYIEYENPVLPKLTTSLWINDKNFIGNESYSMTGMNPINTSNPVGLSLMLDRACNETNDGTIVTMNTNNLGIIGEPDAVNNFWNCSGSKGHFYYQNNTLFGLDDDVANNSMNGADALANISSYLSNGDTGYNLQIVHQNLLGPIENRNQCFLFINAYTTTCDTFSTSIISDTVICRGDSLQLFGSGGSNYSWLPQNSLSNPTLSNPYASPDSTTLYVVQIENTPGCSRTEKVLVKVNELPQVNTISITESVCGNDDGEITINASGNNPLQYSIGNGFQISNSFSNLSTDNYTINILDNNGCTFDTNVFVPEINPVNAYFTATPQSGAKPLSVDLNNQSSNANSYVWLMDGNVVSNNYNESYLFNSSGTYIITLIAFNNQPECADTFSLQIIVYDSLIIQIPNIFTPNSDGVNDAFSITTEGAKEISVNIVNRWGNIIYEYRNNSILSSSNLTIWDGKSHGEKVTDGVYYYTINITDKQDKTYSYQGFIHVLN